MKKQILLISALLLCLSTLPAAHAAEPSSPEYDLQRERMVKYQLRSRDIDAQPVLEAMKTVPRHRFVPKTYQDKAYGDHPLPIGEDQTISQPYIVALMSQVLKVAPGQKVLEIGTGSGYQAAILAEMGAKVYTIEIVESLGQQAKKVLAELGYADIHVKIGDGYQGWPEHAPFDRIIVTCAPTQVPDPLKKQLAEGGRMVIPVGKTFAQELVVLTKTQGKLKKQHILPVRFVPMVDEKGKSY